MTFKFLFWFSLSVICYTYIGYAILIAAGVKLKQLFAGKRQASPPAGFEPEVSLVISAYNEADFIEKKIRNSLELDYPPQQLRIIVITDGSGDGTPELVRNHPAVQLLHEPERKGKAAAMNRAMLHVRSSYVIFSDANTLLNKDCIRAIIRHYRDPRVGGVAGEKKIRSGSRQQAAGAGEGIYWRYESLLKKLDSAFHTVVGAAGELFSVRSALFQAVPEDTIIEDFVQSLLICKNGYLVRYEPGAYAMETGSASMKEEQKRKIRISAGAFQAMYRLKALFNPFRDPLLFFQFVSHRVLRWTLAPLCLLLLFISSAVLAFSGSPFFYQAVLLLQLVFYAGALIGWFLAGRNLKHKVFYIPYYFTFMNLSVFLGFIRFLKRGQSVVWEKAARLSDPAGQ
jgi:cellulose synthase/poly-beta-1,6-N-acetylglucosamine synthase-like glycosyltransferase